MKARYFLFLHLILLIYSGASVTAKFASRESFPDMMFLILYGLMILLLGIYAVFWQQILKKVPLVFAYANKAVTVIWGMIWGVMLFDETVTPQKVAGILMVVLGIVLYSKEASHDED